MTQPSRYHLSLRLYVVFSLLMAVSAAASGLLLLYLARPFITELKSYQAAQATMLLFTGAGVAGAAAAVAGLGVGLRLAGRIQLIVNKAEALSPPGVGAPRERVRDELGALDAAVGRLTLSMDQFVRDSDILSRLPEGMLLLLPSAELASFNTTAESLLGLRLGPYRGEPILSPAGLFPVASGNEDLARLLDRASAVPRTLQTAEVAVTTALGRPFLLEATAQHGEWGGDSSGIVLLFRDASEKQRIREDIRRTDQLALLGGMAARVAHEIRTPLSTIRGLLELLQTDLPAGDANQAYMDRIIQAVDRQDRLVESLLTLSNPEPEACEAVSVTALIDEVLGLLRPDPRVRVIRPAEPVPPVWGDALRLSEVFTNLIQNAIEATPPDGVVEVRFAPAEGDGVRVAVRNTGAGIPPDVRARIFQPFFTTKARGTGLGLAIARQIVEGHHGRIEVQSDGATETTFVVDLPGVAASAPTPQDTVA